MINDLQLWVAEHAAFIEGLAVTWFVLLALASIPAGLYIVYVYRKRNEEAPFLTRLVMRDVRVWVGVTILLVLVAGSLSRVVVRPWGTLTICVAVTIFAWGLLDDAVTFWHERRDEQRRRSTADQRMSGKDG